MNKVLIIYGPTATGKTALAIKLAKKYNGELISADSRQVYKNLDIGTGKVSFESKTEKHKGYWIVDGVRINGFDLVSPEEPFSVADFLIFARHLIIKIEKSKKLPIIVGGTGFYIRSFIEGLDTQGIPVNPSLRTKLEKLDKEELYQHLMKINSLKAKSMNESDRQNPRRLTRAIEISESEDHSLPTASRPISANSYQIICLNAPNDFLYRRADAWLLTRLQNGMIEEVQKLLNQKIDPLWFDNLGLEYRWISRYVLAKISKEEAIEKLRGDIHSFIRRQKTWFKKFKNIKIYDVSNKFWKSQLDKDVELWYTKSQDGRK